MKPFHRALLCLGIFSLEISSSSAQKDSANCKVLQPNLAGLYTGDCRNGLANGKGDARGQYHYVGTFKNGLADGEGTLYYEDSSYYAGQFQDGIKEGKGEEHFARRPKPDSVVKGFWSGGEYRGKRYITYNFSSTEQFDLTQITPSSANGHLVTIEIGTTSGSPNGSGPAGVVLTLLDLVSPTASILKMTSKYASSFKSYATYEIIKYPCQLFGTLSDGKTFSLELYKAADWKVRLFKNE
jgi:hypothetical protein